MQAVDGVVLERNSLDRYAQFPISTLANEESFDQFVKVINWWVAEVYQFSN